MQMLRRNTTQLIRKFSSTNNISCLPASEVASRVKAVLHAQKSIRTDIGQNDHFVANLKMDRLAVKDLIQKLSSEFCVDVPHSVAEDMNTMNDATNYFSSHPKAR